MNVIWRPQPRQAAFMARGEYEALYGGAAGGGKSDALVMEALQSKRATQDSLLEALKARIGKVKAEG